MRCVRHLAVLLPILLLAAGCARRDQGSHKQEAPYQPYRFDDNLETAATVSAASGQTAARVTDPVVWKDFFTEKDATWELVRGRMGLRDGDLILKGDGESPVIVSPKEFAIDWSLFESVQIRMMAEGGSEVRIRIGPLDMRQKLAPPKQYQVYRFAVDIQAPTGSRPLAVIPTDSPFHLAAIDFIELVPRRTSFPKAAGRQVLGKGEEYRNTIYAHSPSAITYEAPIPEKGRLKFGIGVAEKKPVTFRVLAGPSQSPVFSKTLEDPERWADAEVDLSQYAGRTTKIIFETSSESQGAIGLWANPLLTTAAAKARPNVLVYLVCSMRADHTSLYGYSRDTTPFMKQLGAAGVVFDDAQAQAPWTKGSVPSLLTSIHSYTLGMRQDTDAIPQRAVTLAEALRAAGYSTVGIVTNPYAGRASGLNRGYDYMMEYPVVHRLRTDEADRGTDSAAVNKVAMPWFEQHRDEPFFMYVHTTDPHAPYRPPKEFEERFANPAETEQFNRDYQNLWDKRQYGGGMAVTRAKCKAKGIDPDKFLRRAIDRYDGEIAHADRSLEVLTGKLKELGILNNTLVVVLSDHGEEFWEHGLTGHGHSLYQELVHAVFLMWNPKLLPAPRRVSDTVQLLDVYPTILDLAGVAPQGVMQGQSLAPLAKGQPFQRKGPVMSSRFALPFAKPGGLVPENCTDTYAIWNGPWKLLYRDRARLAGLPEVELYDRRTDRKETTNVASRNSGVAQKLRAEIDQWLKAQDQIRKLLGPGGETTLDRQSIERLRSLGYLGGKPSQ
ncbi:MAG TPA: sulfatase [Bryobacteraceae bacterium]|nr:sulfatase [Bryobacteraceae bacterium]